MIQAALQDFLFPRCTVNIYKQNCTVHCIALCTVYHPVQYRMWRNCIDCRHAGLESIKLESSTLYPYIKWWNLPSRTLKSRTLLYRFEPSQPLLAKIDRCHVLIHIQSFLRSQCIIMIPRHICNVVCFLGHLFARLLFHYSYAFAIRCCIALFPSSNIKLPLSYWRCLLGYVV